MDMKNESNRLFLVRHGENLANINREFSYRKVDHPLTPKGMLQAKQTAMYFQDKNIHEVYCSPLKRARQTAEIIAQQIGLTPIVMENFREVNVGSLEGHPASPDDWRLFFRIAEEWFHGRSSISFPEGEDYDTLWERMREGIIQIVRRKTSRNIIVVGHGGIFTVTMKDLCRNIDLDLLWTSENHNCSITEVAVRLRKKRLVGELISWASCAHLSGAAAVLLRGAPLPEDLGPPRRLCA